MKNLIVIEDIFSFPRWNDVLNYALELADRFGVVFPDGEYNEENPLLAGKPEFERLPDLTIEPWNSMEDARIYKGDLTEQAKLLIKEWMDDSEERWSGTLWNFSLYQNEVELLNVQDFNVCLVELETELRVYLDGLDIVRSEDLKRKSDIK